METTTLTTESMMAAVRVFVSNLSGDSCTRELARREYRDLTVDGGADADQLAQAMEEWDRDRDLGEAILREYDVSQSQRTTVFPTTLAANQIAVDAGYIAMSPAWAVFTFRRR